MSKPRAWICWSSGKDSAWALHVVRQQNEVEVVGLLTTVTEPFDRVSMHGVRNEVLVAQAEAVGLPLRRVPIPATCSNEIYQEAMRGAVADACRQDIEYMVFGDLYLEDIREYREQQLASTPLSPIFPLWERPTLELAEEMIASGLVAHLTCLDPRRMPRELAGHPFDRELLGELPSDVDPCAENGEFHTCVSAGPMFSSPIEVELGPVVEREGFVFADLTLAR